jgi:hypothetical protein
MTTHEFLSMMKDNDLMKSKSIKVKKHWHDKAPTTHPVGSANFVDNDLVFHVSDYGDLKLERIAETIEEKNEGLLRVGSFQVHYIQPTFNGFNLVIHKKHDKLKKSGILTWLFSLSI